MNAKAAELGVSKADVLRMRVATGRVPRPPNAELRTREYLTPAEVEKLIKEARQGRYGHRHATLILLAFRHGLRASEICESSID